MHADRFGFGELKSVLISPLLNAIYTPLNLTFDCYKLSVRKQIQKSSTYNESPTPAGKHLMILFIFNMNKVTDKIAPCGTPIS